MWIYAKTSTRFIPVPRFLKGRQTNAREGRRIVCAAKDQKHLAAFPMGSLKIRSHKSVLEKLFKCVKASSSATPFLLIFRYQQCFQFFFLFYYISFAACPHIVRLSSRTSECMRAPKHFARVMWRTISTVEWRFNERPNAWMTLMCAADCKKRLIAFRSSFDGAHTNDDDDVTKVLFGWEKRAAVGRERQWKGGQV